VLADYLPGASSVTFRDDASLFITEALSDDAWRELNPAGIMPQCAITTTLLAAAEQWLSLAESWLRLRGPGSSAAQAWISARSARP
jgi:hypothetical protein